MPVVEVRSLPHARDCNLILARLCQEVAAVEGGDDSGVWATWQFVSHYVVGGQDASSQPPGSHSPIVRLLALEGRSLEVRQALLRTVDRVLTEELGLEPGNVFVELVEARRGLILDGGEIIA
ncbi:hypothetical protein DYH09_31090 [bacterium CPR1]|nr:hypothetical protein [bacterium CPR1]